MADTILAQVKALQQNTHENFEKLTSADYRLLKGLMSVWLLEHVDQDELAEIKFESK